MGYSVYIKDNAKYSMKIHGCMSDTWAWFVSIRPEFAKYEEMIWHFGSIEGEIPPKECMEMALAMRNFLATQRAQVDEHRGIGEISTWYSISYYGDVPHPHYEVEVQELVDVSDFLEQAGRRGKPVVFDQMFDEG